METQDSPRPTTEARMIGELRAWSKNANAGSEQPVDKRMYVLVEGFICDCIRYGPKQLYGWWSDGIVHLEIVANGTDSFKLVGVTWIDSDGLAPFEIDIQLKPGNDEHFGKTVFRIGSIDERGKPKLSDTSRHVDRVVEERPRSDRDWAMAIELTPPENRD